MSDEHDVKVYDTGSRDVVDEIARNGDSMLKDIMGNLRNTPPYHLALDSRKVSEKIPPSFGHLESPDPGDEGHSFGI